MHPLIGENEKVVFETCYPNNPETKLIFRKVTNHTLSGSKGTLLNIAAFNRTLEVFTLIDILDRFKQGVTLFQTQQGNY